jgi:hypothetical protein
MVVRIHSRGLVREVVSVIISESVDIAAPPAIVWQAVIDERRNYKTLVGPRKTPGGLYTITQEYPNPLMTAKATFLIEEIPFIRMNFTLIDSNFADSLKGYWNYEDKGKTTKLTLNIETIKLKFFPVPKVAIKYFAVKQIKDRLRNIKNVAESLTTHTLKENSNEH